MAAVKEKVRRQVKGVFVVYSDVVTDLAGNDRLVRRTGRRGATIDIDADQAARLDELGLLVPEGHEIDGVSEDEVRAALERALNPTDTGLTALGPAPSVAPPGLGVAPVGELLTGDTGGPDSPPVAAEEPAGAVVRSPVDDTVALEARIRDEKLNVEETVALAGDDPARAQAVLVAETAANDGAPRKTVVEALAKVLGGAEGSAATDASPGNARDYSGLKRPQLVEELESRNLDYPKGVGVKNVDLIAVLEADDRS